MALPLGSIILTATRRRRGGACRVVAKQCVFVRRGCEAWRTPARSGSYASRPRRRSLRVHATFPSGTGLLCSRALKLRAGWLAAGARNSSARASCRGLVKSAIGFQRRFTARGSTRSGRSPTICSARLDICTAMSLATRSSLAQASAGSDAAIVCSAVVKLSSRGESSFS